MSKTSGTGEFCNRCGKEFLMFWDDTMENGFSEPKFTEDELCYDCCVELDCLPSTLQEIHELRSQIELLTSNVN